jgi:hypothetical protein
LSSSALRSSSTEAALVSSASAVFCCIARARCLDPGVERQRVGLEGDCVDEGNHFADLRQEAIPDWIVEQTNAAA